MKNGFPGPGLVRAGAHRGWPGRVSPREPGLSRSRNLRGGGQEVILAPAHLPAGRAVLHCQTWAPCPALLLTGPEGEGRSRIYCRPCGPRGCLCLGRWVPFPTEDVLFRVQLERSFWLWVEKQPLSRRLAGRCSWERCWRRAAPEAPRGTRGQSSPVQRPSLARAWLAGGGTRRSRWLGRREGV